MAVKDYPPLDGRSRSRLIANWPAPSQAVKADSADLYNKALLAACNGTPPPTLHHTTGLHVDVWERAATGHPDDIIVHNGIKQGFPIQYAGPVGTGLPIQYNHQSAHNFAAYIDDYIHNETAHGALEGPFVDPPFTPWFVASPLMSREKSGGDGRRTIVDLSFPDGGVNQYIQPHRYEGQPAVHNLPTIQAAVETIAATCPGRIHMAVIDLSRAYRQFPVAPLDWPLLGIGWKGAWSFDRRLPFGCRMSSFIMQSIANYIMRALASQHIHAHMYLDDILMVAPVESMACRQYSTIL